jgi:branched-chain amino acid transport system permease protein
VAAEGPVAAEISHMTRARPSFAAIGHALPWAIAIGYFYVAQSYLSFGTQVMIWILFAMSLDLALGYAGILTLGHAGFFGLGAYSAGLFAIHLSPDPILGHLAAVGVAALFGAVTGAMILHTSGVTLLMLTLAIVSVMSEYANQARGLTGGDDGLQGIKLDPIFGMFEFNIFGKTAYVYALIVLFGWFLVAWRIVHSPFGRSLDGIRQNPRRMRAIGTPVWWRLLAAYTISAAMAGSAGALSAYATRFVGLSVLSLLTSGVVAVVLILGGTRRIYGAFLGATIYFVVQDYSAKISPYFWEFIVGGMLIATVLLLEGGLLDLAPAALRLRDRWRAAKAAK